MASSGVDKPPSPPVVPPVVPPVKTGLWQKRDTSTGRFMALKAAGGVFKGVKRER